ncbi:voltage-gated ion channel superfamily [Micromonas commoda]|uniref:Voltage-gated ion channel superfamily n=1 Tax=Micromonas commoda (strain RCC299 / NOUM17 / CCMP2709) TaxID=296587 RepID=C1E9E0_MICCC|nr:voltage-gated ion channel superfamily [Micromonas commoda]ACO64315.1 voltage-gated ion channel superfamily [Micromonas commoda]|eukprot:XP_002503057.1 voltage-gated ion channel superfamily [Micromonas commoda]
MGKAESLGIESEGSIWLAEHPKSLFLFDEENPFRKFCRSIARSAWFDIVIFAVIFANTVTMASLDMRDPNAQNAEGMAEAEFASTMLYAAEALVKIVDQGFWFAPDTYMDSGWNQFDFLLVCGTLVSLFESRLGTQFLALRAFRCFRPLRAMKNFRDGQLLMRTTLAAIPLLRDALIFLCWFMLVASITGTMLFGGKLNARCVEPAGWDNSTVVGSCPVKELVNRTYQVAGETMTRHVCDPHRKGHECDYDVGEICCNSNTYPQAGFLSFDNFWRSAIIVLQTITIDGWNESAKLAADASGIARVGPYFAILVFFGGFYVLQLFTSVMIITLSHCSDKLEEQEAEAEERERLGLPPIRGTAFDLQEDKVGEFVNWLGKTSARGFVVAKRKIGIKEKDPLAEEKPALPEPFLSYSRKLQQLCENAWFGRTVLFVIVMNTVSMAANSYGMGDAYYEVLDGCELTFTIVFIVEFVIKHLAYGPEWYWSNRWNIIDGIIVISGVLELSMGSGADGVALLRMLRVMRILAGLKGLRQYRAFQTVFRAVINGVVRIGSFCLVFFLFITVFAILGMQLFGGSGDMNVHRSHFDNFGTAVMTLFIMCTGENTFSVGWDLMQATGESSSVIYVIVWSLVSTSLLALVLGVLIEAASRPIQEELEGGGSGGAGFGPDSIRTKSGKFVEIRGEETALTMLTSSKTRQALEAIEKLRKKGVDEATIEKSDEMRTLNRLREEVRAEVAAVRIWLFQTGMDLQVRKSTIPMPSSPVSMLRRQREIELENQAKVQELSDGFSHEELHEARERLVTTTAHKKLADVPENVVQKEAAIKFSIGNTQSTVSSVEEMLERKRKRREQILKEEAAAREEDPVVRRERLFRERCVQCGIEVDKPDSWNTARAKCLSIVDQRWFQGTVLVLIVISACLLAPQCDADWPTPGSKTETAMEAIDISFTVAFLIEMVLKLVALTVYSGPNAYIKDYWNCLDGFIVTMSIVTLLLDLISGGSTGGVLKVFRVLRVLRPLRVIKNVPSLKLVIDATFVSMPAIITVCAMGLLCFLVLGVLGMQLFKGTFYSCTHPGGNPGGTKDSCEALGGEWRNAPFHFDNIGQAIISIFILSTGDNWQDLMWEGVDSVGEEKEPVYNNRRVSALFYVVVVIITFFFWLNLFVSALVDNFSQVASSIQGDDESTSGYCYSESQRKWLLALKAGLDAARESWRDIEESTVGVVRRVCLRMRKWKYWELFVTLFITANAIQMCFFRVGVSEEEQNVMDTLGIVFCCLYVAETVVNIIAMTWPVYWDENWHKLDFVVTVSGVIELATSFTGESSFLTVFRTARFFRLFKVLKSSPGLRSLVDTFLTALPSMLNIFGLMLLLMHIYACLGCTLYGKIDPPYEGDGLTPYTNFQNWGNAMWLLFVTLSGNWVTAFHDVFWSCQNMEQDPVTGAYGSCPYRVSAVPYFFSFVIFGICLLCNLFVAILLERFDYASTMEGVYDDRNPFDTLFRLNVIRQFVFKIRNRMRLVRALKANKKIDTDGLEFHEINLIIQKELARQRENRANGIEETREGRPKKENTMSRLSTYLQGKGLVSTRTLSMFADNIGEKKPGMFSQAASRLALSGSWTKKKDQTSPKSPK